MDRICTMTVGLLADRKDTLRRILSRDGLTAEQARARMANQPRDTYYVNHCDLTLCNGGSREDLERAAKDFCRRYLPAPAAAADL